MIKTKRQLRAEAVERLKNSVGARLKPDAAVIAIVGGRIGQADWSLECDKLIDLLTDDELPEGDALEIMRRAIDNQGSPTFCALIRDLGISDGMSVSWNEAEDALRMLADMVERDYVPRKQWAEAVRAMKAAQDRMEQARDERDELQRQLNTMRDVMREFRDERDEWKAEAESNSHGWAKANMGWAEANAEAETWRQKCDEWKAKAEQATNQPTSQSDAPKTGETAENDASKCEMRDFDDSREKLEADVWAASDLFALRPSAVGDFVGIVTALLDRQADITAREWCHSIDGLSQENDELRARVDELEADIAERYIELPIDGDGEILEIGDELECQGKSVLLNSLSWDGRRWYATETVVSSGWYPLHLCRHVKPRTVEDVLHNFWEEWESHPIDVEWGVRLERLRESEAKYADEIRDLLGGDAE